MGCEADKIQAQEEKTYHEIKPGGKEVTAFLEEWPAFFMYRCCKSQGKLVLLCIK